MNHPTPQTYRIPILVEVEADNPHIALAEVERIRTAILDEERHLEVRAIIPGKAEPLTPLHLPQSTVCSGL